MVDKSVYKTTSHTFTYDTVSGSDFEITYLGCGGFNIRRDSSSILIDPFFSNPGFLKVGVSSRWNRTLKTNTRAVENGLRHVHRIDSANDINSIWVSHSHYDHLMDIPYVYNHYPSPGAKVYCSKSGQRLIAPVVDDANVQEIETHVSRHDTLGTPYYLENNRIRVTPIMAEHAPHYLKFRMYNGESNVQPKYDSDTARSYANMWKLGMTFSFVFDYLDEDGHVEFRIFLQSSASTPKQGWIPQKLRKERDVDLAILGAASYAYVDDYPQPLIDAISPTYLIVCHWEDFFKPYSKQRKKTVRATRVSKFIGEVHEVYPWKVDGIEKFILPKPGAKIYLNLSESSK